MPPIDIVDAFDGILFLLLGRVGSPLIEHPWGCFFLAALQGASRRRSARQQKIVDAVSGVCDTEGHASSCVLSFKKPTLLFIHQRDTLVQHISQQR